MMLAKDAGHTERGVRNAFASEVAGREIESAKDMSFGEASAVIDAYRMGLSDSHEEVPA